MLCNCIFIIVRNGWLCGVVLDVFKEELFLVISFLWLYLKVMVIFYIYGLSVVENVSLFIFNCVNVYLNGLMMDRKYECNFC